MRKGNRITINWTRRPSYPAPRHRSPPPGSTRSVGGGQGGRRTHIIALGPAPPPVASGKRGPRVQASSERGRRWCKRPRFYGGSLLKVRCEAMSGDFLPKRAEMAGPLCACASLRFFERGTLETKSFAFRNYLAAGARRVFARRGLGSFRRKTWVPVRVPGEAQTLSFFARVEDINAAVASRSLRIPPVSSLNCH